MQLDQVRALVRDVPDFPKPGILFKDITPVLQDGPAFRLVLDWFEERARAAKAEVIAGPESRGFLFGTPLADRLGVGFVPIRKPGKLPWRTRSKSYALEYGEDALEAHEDAFRPYQNVFLVDDLLATGGTMGACRELVSEMGARVSGVAFLIELAFLKGREKLDEANVDALITY